MEAIGEKNEEKKIMKIKTFDLPSFDEWVDKHSFRQNIAEYECNIHGHYYVPKFTNELIFEASIKYYAFDGPRVIFESRMSCFQDDYYHLSRWYKDVTSKINKEWIEYITDKYLE